MTEPATNPEPARESPHEHDCAYGPGGYHRFARDAVALVEAEVRADERRKAAADIHALAAREGARLRTHLGIGDAVPLNAAINNWIGGIREAARLLLGECS